MSDKTSPPTDAPPAPADDWRTATGQLAAVSATVTRLAARDTAHGLRAYAAAWGREAPHMAVSLALGCVVAAALFALAMTRASADTTGADAAAHATALFGAVATQDAAGIGASTATPAAQTGEAPADLLPAVREWWPQIVAAATAHGVPPRLLACIVTAESSGDSLAQSNFQYRDPATGVTRTEHAYGLAQIAYVYHPDYDIGRGKSDPAYNLDYGAAYLAELLAGARGDVALALHRYNGNGYNNGYVAGITACNERGA